MKKRTESKKNTLSSSKKEYFLSIKSKNLIFF